MYSNSFYCALIIMCYVLELYKIYDITSLSNWPTAQSVWVLLWVRVLSGLSNFVVVLFSFGQLWTTTFLGILYLPGIPSSVYRVPLLVHQCQYYIDFNIVVPNNVCWNLAYNRLSLNVFCYIIPIGFQHEDIFNCFCDHVVV